uniref:NACHT domain-containing protein n=1 Tax=Anopheles minimus TaxID=112268 RepID=A0A182WLZ3_9DIPT
MANKATTDGVVFQRRLCYYVCGLVHREHDYSVLYEGDDNTYGALDDVILRVESAALGAANVWLYCFQAKQTVDDTKTLSIQDVLHYKVNLTKYMDSYKKYMGSAAHERDGTPTEMIYWTVNDFHATSQQFVEEHISSEPHLMLTIDSIKKYKITHWKALFMFDTAQKLAIHCSTQSRKKDNPKYTYLNESVSEALAREVLQLVSGDPAPKVTFREPFLQGAACLSDNAKQFRKSFVIACEMLHTNPKAPTFDITSLTTVTFTTDAFNVEKLNEPYANPELCRFQYNGLDEGTLNWFFEHFIFYVGVPKGEPMVKAIKDLYNDHFSEEMFDRYLIEEPVKRAQPQGKDKKQQQEQACFMPKPYVESVMKMVELKEFMRSTPYGDWLIRGEVQAVVLLDLPDIAHCSKQIARQFEQKVKVVAIVSEPSDGTALSNVIVDEIDLCDVIVDYEQLEIKCISFDDKTLLISNYIPKEAMNSIKKVEELSTLTNIIVKSDVYNSDERHYIDRNLLGEGGKIVTHAELLARPARSVSIICDTAGQGKTTELLRIAEQAQNVDECICLYLRAKTIAKGITQTDSISAPVALQTLQKLLYITPRSLLVEEIVQHSLEQMQLCLLVDGFDEIVEQYQELVMKFLHKVLQHAAGCSVVLATRHESLPVLKKAFKNASYYGLAPFSYETYFQQLWLSDPHERSPVLEQNVHIFISNFDQLLKATGCKSFLEVPQLCKIMGTIYHDRIRKPNIQWYTNYEIGSIYDTFVQSQLANTLSGKFDETDKLHTWARSLIRTEYYKKHAQLAYELEYNYHTNPEHYEQLQRFGLIMMQYGSSKGFDFTHRTVMDYFLVRSCTMHDIEEEDFYAFLRRYFCVSRANIADKFIDFFLQNTQCLSSRKKRIIGSYLYSGSNILPTCIRMALNNATFNTLRMLLSVAPKELLNPLCFRFGATTNQQGNEINLKRLGERQTLLLLETLKKCDDEYVDADDDEEDNLSILERMLFEADPNEEDTMEVAMRKPFPEVFDWVHSGICWCGTSQFETPYLTQLT